MKERKLRRVADPLWIACCKLWDALEPEDHKTIVQAMQLLAAKRQQSEGPENAEAPVKELRR